MKNILNKINELAQSLTALLPMKPEDQQRLEKKFRLEFNYHSNHMEGNTLTYGETELLLIFGDTKGNHTLREYEEMKGHDIAIKLIEDLAADKEHPLTESFIKNLNQVLLKEPFWKEAITADGQNTRRLIKVGNYKEYPNSVRLQNGEIFNYASPAETPILMQELIDWYRTEETTLHPATLAAMLHYKFVRIHPFDDGNGRIARLLINYVFLKNNLPTVIIKSGDKQNYLRALNQADAGDLNVFVNYIVEQLVWSLEISIRAAKGENVEEDEDYIKEIKLIKHKTKNLALPKSPKLVFDVFKMISKEIWNKLNETLSNFDELFTDNNTVHYVDSLEEKFPTKNIFQSPFIISNEPTKSKIFGYDIYETDVRKIEWCHTNFGLRGSEDNSKLEINLNISFEIKSYIIKLSVNYKDIYEVEKQYNDLLFNDDAEKMNKELKKIILLEIKKRTKNIK